MKAKNKDKDKPKSELAVLLGESFPGLRFQQRHWQMAGKILKKRGREAVLEFMKDKGSQNPPNFQPPAKCNIVCQSRSFDMWPVFKASCDIQKHIYALSVQEVTDMPTKKDAIEQWFKSTGVDSHGFSSVQGLGLIFKHAKNTFDGVIIKVNNRNEKKRKRQERVNRNKVERGEDPSEYEMELAVDDTGHLVHPPGVNGCIYCYQQASPHVFDPARPGAVVLPPEYAGYSRQPNNPIILNTASRLSIPAGTPGYVPEHQRKPSRTNPGIKMRPGKRLRRYYAHEPGNPSMLTAEGKAAKACDAILAVINIDKDWVVLDMRGLLRNARWRKLVPKTGITATELLKLFTGDPVIDTKRNLVTFSYNLDTIQICSRDTYKRKKTREMLLKAASDGPVALVSIDLGKHNPVAARYSRVSVEDGVLKSHHAEYPAGSAFLPSGEGSILEKIRKYMVRHDVLESQIKADAVASLTIEQQQEIRAVENNIMTIEEAKQRICERFKLDHTSIPWDKMNSNSVYIANAALANGVDPSEVYFEKKRREKKKVQLNVADPAPKLMKRYDYGMSRLNGIRRRVSDETRKAQNDAERALKRDNKEYQRLSRSKAELARQIANHLLREAKEHTQCEQVVFAIEDLNMPFFHGNGRRDLGWNSFFAPKKENRWMVQAIHKAITELGVHRGALILEVEPRNTSITCPKCRTCNRDSRDGERFTCVACKHTCHADADVATFNIECVAMTGKTLPGYKKPGGKKSGEQPKKQSNRSAITPVSIMQPKCEAVQIEQC